MVACPVHGRLRREARATAKGASVAVALADTAPQGCRQYHQRWGRSARAGSDPYDDVQAALRFLQKRGVLDTWPAAIGEGRVVDGTGVIEPRAAPYRFTIVMLEPTVVVMRFDLGALVKVGAFDAAESLGTPRLNQGVAYGTRFPAAGTLLWFSPDADQLPTPVTLTSPEHGEIVAQGRRLTLDRRGDAWVVGAPQRAATPPRPTPHHHRVSRSSWCR